MPRATLYRRLEKREWRKGVLVVRERDIPRLLEARLEKHGMSKSKLYSRWTTMMNRDEACERWRSFLNFAEDVGDSPLKRIDPKKPYSPENCGL